MLIPDRTAEVRPAKVEAVTRAAKVEAFSPWSQTAVREMTGERPNIDFALTALVVRLSLPLDAPFQIFATARCTGWIAHALEQSKTGKLIRPRARYVGVQPSDAIRDEAEGVGALEGFRRCFVEVGFTAR